MEIKDILEYYIEYENYNLLNSVTDLKKSNIKTSQNDEVKTDFNKKYLNNGDHLSQNIAEQVYQECFNVIGYRIRNLGPNAKEVIRELRNLCSGLMKLDEEEIDQRLNQLFTHLFKVETDTVKQQKKEIQRILMQKEFSIFYPMYWVNKKYIPLCAYKCTISGSTLKVKSYAVIEVLLNAIMKKHYLLDEYFSSMTEKEDFFKAINNFKNDDIVELSDIIIGAITKRLDGIEDKLIKEQEDFFMISFNGSIQSYTPPFKEEIVLTQYLLKDHSSKLLKNYLLEGHQKDYRSDLKNLTHMGSYPFGINCQSKELPLYTVNEKQWNIMNLYEQSDLQSVTGPPGTGKTTVLKEMIADTFVQKTHALLEIWDKPWDKYDEKDKEMFYIAPFKGENLFSMIITSTNNNAVNNIGDELSREIKLFNLSDLKLLEITFCAQMGNRENIERFTSASLFPLIQALSEVDKFEEDVEMIEAFKENYLFLEKFNDELMLYDKACVAIQKHFNKELKYEESQLLRDGFSTQRETYKNEIDKNEEMIISLKLKSDELNQKMIMSRKELSTLKRRLNDEENILSQIEMKTKWFVVGKIFKILKSDEIEQAKQSLELLRQEVDETEQLLNYYSEENTVAIKQTEDSQAIIDARKSELPDIDLKLMVLNTFISQYERLLKLMTDYDLPVSKIHSRYDLCNCDAILAKRFRLFQLALNINEMYILKNRTAILYALNEIYKPNNLFSSCYRSSYVYDDYTTYKLRNLWEVFCLCYPVITTTLHSFERSKFHMLPQLFDRIMVDESGQVMPHYLVGPLFRARKALIVGDVYQLKPVRKQLYPGIFEKYEKKVGLSKSFDLDIKSAQEYADAHSKYYDTLNENKIGLLLEEHRRCEENIASYSNQYVYNGKMILKNKNRPCEEKFLGSNLIFIDVKGFKEKGNKNFAEATFIEHLIEKIRLTDSESEIGVITPYSNQHHLLESHIKGEKEECGTVHKFQGKGKDIIIISLVVSSPSDMKGLSFIGAEPNFLNVALTRAKQQVIIVGNYDILEKANNHLAHLNQVILQRGKIYSFYDESFDMEPHHAETVKSILTAETIKDSRYSQLFSIYEKHEGILTDEVHYKLLLSILNNAKSIEICTPWVNTIVVKDMFLEQLEKFVSDGHKCKIVFGFKPSKDTLSSHNEIKRIISRDNGFKHDKDKEFNMMLRLQNILGESLIYNPPLHSKILIVDREYVVIGSHNWLSKQGQRKGSRRELSCIVKNASMAQYIREEFFKVSNPKK